MKSRLYRVLAVLIPAMAILLAILGIQRLGSLDGFWRRADTEAVARLPHMGLTPTLFPTSTGWPNRVESPSPTTHAGTGRRTVEPTPTATRTQPTARPTRTPSPTPAPTQLPPSPTPTPPPTARPAAVRLTGLTHAWQTWNNCGPATLAMNLSYFGRRTTQADIAAALRPFKDDKNVSPDELAAYARLQGLRALARVNGSPETLRQLLAASVPVLVEAWYEPKPNDGMGHYRLLTGFDDAAREWIAYDAYDARGLKQDQPYTGIRLPYDEVAGLWPVFNRTYLLIYDEARAAAVAQIVGDDLNDASMWSRALTAAEAAIEGKPDDPFAWFNLGTDLVALARYDEAARAYDRARQLGLPWRMLWYQFGPFRAYYETGRSDDVISLADATLRTAQHVEELFFWRGLAQKAKGDLPGARASWERALELNPNYADARSALAALNP
jgi:tetratricopeptide (TPR) repeat protein